MRESLNLAAEKGRSQVQKCCRDCDSKLTLGIRTGTDAVSVTIQIFAPKCTICWTTYAGLLNAGWLTLTTTEPHWLVLLLLSYPAAMLLSILDAWHTRRVWPVAATSIAWLLLVASWFANEPSLRYAGLAILLARTAMI